MPWIGSTGTSGPARELRATSWDVRVECGVSLFVVVILKMGNTLGSNIEQIEGRAEYRWDRKQVFEGRVQEIVNEMVYEMG